mgnify:CR=1 FL=1
MIKIQLVEEAHKHGITELIQKIASEFELPISNPNSISNPSLDNYWVALNKTEIIGTVGIIKMETSQSILKNMFVKKEYRGKDFGVSQSLLNTVFDWCNSQNIHSIYLGTMSQFKAAQKFYEKNGFEKINKNELPTSFIKNSIDDVYYLKRLSL